MQIFSGEKIEVPFEKGRQELSLVDTLRGKTCFIYRGSLLHEVAKYYGRDPSNLCLKIFFTPLTGELDSYYWGSKWRIYSEERTEEIGRISKLTEAVTIQNWLWMQGKAPRVYALLTIDRKGKFYPALLTDYLQGEQYKGDVSAKVVGIAEEDLKDFKIRHAHKELVGSHDFIDGKLIDPQGFGFTDKTHEAVRDYVNRVGKYGKTHYQDIAQIGLTGKPRNTGKRIEAMKLNEIDFEDKDVLDVGCNSGAFCMYASSRGARRVIGLDTENNVKAAQVLAFYLGYHNVDYIAKDLTKEKIDFEPHITLFLSMNIHIGLPEWVVKQTKELMVFEENAKQSKFKPEHWKKELGKYFDLVEQIGTTNDQNPQYHKPIFWCRKVVQ